MISPESLAFRRIRGWLADPAAILQAIQHAASDAVATVDAASHRRRGENLMKAGKIKNAATRTRRSTARIEKSRVKRDGAHSSPRAFSAMPGHSTSSLVESNSKRDQSCNARGSCASSRAVHRSGATPQKE